MPLSIGCKVSYKDGGDWIPVSGDNLSDVTLPNEMVEALERITHGTDDYRKRKVPGMIDPGSAGFSCFYDGELHSGLKVRMLDRDLFEWKFETPQNDEYATVVTFEAFIKSINPNFSDIAALSKLEVELELTGKDIVYSGDTDTDD